MVGKICTVCRRCSYIDKQLSFFQYPSDPKRRYEWLQQVDRMDLAEKVDNFKTRGNHRICEVHFEKRFLLQCEGKKCLTKDAFPTLLLNHSGVRVPPPASNTFTKPQSPTTNKKEPTWGECQVTDSIKSRLKKQMSLKEVVPRRKSARQEEIAMKTVKIYNEHFNDRVPSPQSPIDFQDVSQFCESIIKDTKSTQTFVTGNVNSQIEVSKLLNNKSKTENVDKEMFIQMCKKFLPHSLYKILEWHFSSSNSEDNVNLTLLAIYLYYFTNSYDLLRDMLNLPTKKTLKYFLLPKSTRLSETFINAFKCKVSNMTPKERICSFSVGSILLQPNLYYDIKQDRIIGFHDVNGKQNIGVAKYAIVIMVQGILKNWIQPISYAFISEYNNYPEIALWIDETLITLIDIGLDIKVFVSDPRSEFLYASQSRCVTPEKTYFTINYTDIFYTYDTTQLFKIVKNNAKSCKFVYGPHFVIRDEEFFSKLDNLCNVLNSKTQYTNDPYKKAFTNKKYETDFLEEMLLLFEELKVVRKADNVDVTENMKFVDGFQITINSVLQLFHELIPLGVKYLLTSRLNHNNLNRFFTKIKSKNEEDECTPRQFHKAFVRSFVFNMLKKPIGNDSLETLLDSKDFSQKLFEEEFKDQSIIESLSINTTDYRQGLPDKNSFVYVCGYCYLKCVQHHSCDAFKIYQKCRKMPKAGNLCSVSLDLNVKSCEMMPPEDFTDYLMLLETKFKDYLKENVPIHNIGRELLAEFEKYEFPLPCPCFPIKYLNKLFARVRIFYTVRKNNKLLKRKKGMKMIKVFSL